MIYAIDGLNIYEILSILIVKTERSDTTNLQYSIVNIQFGYGLAGLGLNSNKYADSDTVFVP